MPIEDSVDGTAIHGQPLLLRVEFAADDLRRKILLDDIDGGRRDRTQRCIFSLETLSPQGELLEFANALTQLAILRLQRCAILEDLLRPLPGSSG